MGIQTMAAAYMAERLVNVSVEDGIAIITLNDPDVLNAASPQMGAELLEIFRRLTLGVISARVCLLTGAGRGFCTGAKMMPDRELGPRDVDGKIDVGHDLEGLFNPLVTAIRDLPIPIVAAVNGPAVGVGCSLALIADLIVAAESAYFMQAFRAIGLVPDGGASYMLPRDISRVRAMELMLLGDRLPAAKALEWGLVNRCVPDDKLMEEALTICRRLAAGPLSQGLIRRMVWQSLDSSWIEQLQREREGQRAASKSEDFAEGFKAFLEKRPAKYSGA